eukprot:TRINITY_DN8488_c0_g1_i1.p1 TRINITY_DN8488_c0_g1~~TRINITY_DN8488_c0_g1_i1.p1  ORF type:complete len:540 (-),score=159.74 TRINITY_DN8488_c0_g1_i1:66-1460(-)
MDQHRRTPLHMAAFFGKTEAVEKLLDRDADPLSKAMDAFLPLHFAAQAGHLEVLRLLVRKVGAKGEHGLVKRYVNYVVQKGKKSALHLAVQKGHFDCARFLVMKGSSCELKTSQGQTALELCQDEGLRKELAGKAVTAAAEEATEEASTKEAGKVEEASAAEPPAKRRAVEPAAAKPAPAVAEAPPMQALPSEPCSLGDLCPAALLCGPLTFADVEVEAEEAERSYPAGVPAMADVEWDLKLKEEPGLTDGPVWCLLAHEQRSGAKGAHLKLQRSTKRLLHYTHFSDDAAMPDREVRCNACCLRLLMETSDGLLVLGQVTASGSLCLVPEAGALSSSSLLHAVAEALASFPPLADGEAAASALGSARLLGLLDAGLDAPDGHRHELVIGIRLPMTASEVGKGYAASPKDGQTLAFVASPGVEVPTEAAEQRLNLEELLAEGSKLPESQCRALRLLQALRGGKAK